MAANITLTSEGTLITWLKKVGEPVKQGDVIAEIESDKATVEIEAPASGVLIAQNANPGDALAAGAVIGSIGEGGEQPAAQEEKAPAQPEKAVEPVEQKQAAPQKEVVVTPVAQPAVGQAVVVSSGNGDYPGGVKASPLARRMAREKGIDLRQVKGSGPGGRVTKEDVEGFTPSAAPAVSVPVGIVAPPSRKAPAGEDVEILEVNRMRQRIAAVTVESKQQIPHFYVTVEMDSAPLLDLRKQLNASVTDEAQKITVNDLIVKAAALTLRQFPNLNTHYYGDRYVRHKRINIGIAVPTNNGGLINVVCKDADKAPLSVIAQQNKEMIARAREAKVKPEDVEGATFTVSNMGMYDVEHFVAIINPPEAGILAIGSAKQTPVVNEDGSLGVGSRMKITISVDHRVSDGAEAARYLGALKDLIEHPIRMLI